MCLGLVAGRLCLLLCVAVSDVVRFLRIVCPRLVEVEVGGESISPLLRLRISLSSDVSYLRQDNALSSHLR